MTYIWTPPRELVESANVTHFMDKLGINDYRSLVERSRREHLWWWSNLPQWLRVEWFREPRETLDLSNGPEWAKWYRGGLVNLAYNVIDRPASMGLGSRTAFIWLGENGEERRITYSELKDMVDRFAGYLRGSGVKPGDVVAIYAPMLPETVAAMLGAVKVGAIASPIFSGFAAPAVAERLRQAEPKVMVTVDGYLRKGREIVTKPEADKAIEESRCGCRVVVVERLGKGLLREGRDESWREAVEKAARSPEPEELDPEHPALLLFTSGTTGKPKGAVISHIGALLQPAKEHYFNLDIRAAWETPGARDLLWWITDLGWMMGPWQVIGTLFLGQASLAAEGALDKPTRTRVLEIIDRYGVTHLGFAATAARLLRRLLAPEDIENHSLETLRAFGNTGEPIDHSTWMWVMKDLGREKRPLINLSGGTEIFGCFLLPSPVVPLKPTTLWGPGLGMDVDVVDDQGNPVRGRPGYLVALKPAPSMTRGLWRDPERYIKTYWSKFPGKWFHGDLALIDEDDYWYILGRADDVIKVAGKRIGPAEIETVINSHPEVAESACIGVPDPVKGEEVACLYIPRSWPPSDEEQLNKQLQRLVEERLGKPFRPRYLAPVPDLPRTRSGKIVRRLVKALARGLPLGDASTLENPEALEYVKQALRKLGITPASGED